LESCRCCWCWIARFGLLMLRRDGMSLLGFETLLVLGSRRRRVWSIVLCTSSLRLRTGCAHEGRRHIALLWRPQLRPCVPGAKLRQREVANCRWRWDASLRGRGSIKKRYLGIDVLFAFSAVLRLRFTSWSCHMQRFNRASQCHPLSCTPESLELHNSK